MNHLNLVGDCRAVLREQPAKSVHVVCTSPPYWGLRLYSATRTFKTEAKARAWAQEYAAECQDKYGSDISLYLPQEPTKREDGWAGSVVPVGVWGGVEGCEHEWGEKQVKKGQTGGPCVLVGAGKNMTEARYTPNITHQFCRHCNAWLGQLGLEPTPQLYVQHLVEVAREVWRVLRDDGVFWLNLGDSYATGAGSGNIAGGGRQGERWQGATPRGRPNVHANRIGLKPKDLVGVPWLAAFALRDDGWYLRKDNIWAKAISFCPDYSGSCMPKSVSGWRWERHMVKAEEPFYEPCPDCGGTGHQTDGTLKIVTLAAFQDGTSLRNGDGYAPCPTCDGTGQIQQDRIPCPGCGKCEKTGGLVLSKGSWRTTSSHEYVFHLAKTDVYYGDGDAIHEDGPTYARQAGGYSSQGSGIGDGTGGQDGRRGLGFKEREVVTTGRNPRSVWTIPPSLLELISDIRKRINESDHIEGKEIDWLNAIFADILSAADVESTWTINPKPFKEAHFATWPPSLVEKMILSSTSPKNCPKCGAPWARVVDAVPNPSKYAQDDDKRGWSNTHQQTSNPQSSKSLHRHPGGVYRDAKTTGWLPTCACEGNDGSARAVVLDPFQGSGTTAMVALELGRGAIGIDIVPDYGEMARKRTGEDITTIESAIEPQEPQEAGA